jgi:apolipoprotein N-acyltransferase
MFDLEFLAWFALIPLFTATKDKSPGFSFVLCFVTGISFFIGVFSWINDVSGFSILYFLILGVYLGSYVGIFGLLSTFISRRSRFPLPLIAPALWVSLEYLRSHAGFLSLPWALLGHSQYLNLPLMQISSLTGVYGISFLIIMVNVALYEILIFLFDKRKGWAREENFPLGTTIISAALVTGSIMYGFTVLSEGEQKVTIPVTVIQGNIAQQIKWDPVWRKRNLDKHVRLTRESTDIHKASMIVWPETAVTVPLQQYYYSLKFIPSLAKELQTYMLVGSSRSPKFGSVEYRLTHNFNTAFLFSPGGRFAGQYDKIRLLPFGEYLPYDNLFRWPQKFRKLINETGADVPGNKYEILQIGSIPFGVTICWENIFPDLFRQFVRRGALFMVNMTNEAWFGESAAPGQFVAMNVFRAAENRISIVRAANTGISCFIDPHGRIMGKVERNNKDIFVDGYLTTDVPLSTERTFYTQYGDVFAYFSISFAVALVVVSPFRKKRLSE